MSKETLQKKWHELNQKLATLRVPMVFETEIAGIRLSYRGTGSGLCIREVDDVTAPWRVIANTPTEVQVKVAGVIEQFMEEMLENDKQFSKDIDVAIKSLEDAIELLDDDEGEEESSVDPRGRFIEMGDHDGTILEA